jgi:hypothetical protein
VPYRAQREAHARFRLTSEAVTVDVDNKLIAHRIWAGLLPGDLTAAMGGGRTRSIVADTTMGGGRTQSR